MTVAKTLDARIVSRYNECMDTTEHLTNLDAQIAAIEAEIENLPRTARKQRAALAKQHEQLVARVQRWTVGTSRGMEVL